ncbi:alpha/beta-hydrolase [Clavulina sp. PMI_390]|nr:alpha/beta-hydrolase [Clavulina sp. PMI_390]
MSVDTERSLMPRSQLSLRLMIGRVLFAAVLILTFLHYTVPYIPTILSHCSGQLGLGKTTLKDPIDWTECGNNSECGTLQVPLDYHNATKGNITLSVGRYLATSKPEQRLGSLFVNPGGPGSSGVEFMLRVGPQLSEIFDGRYDIVSWDPRGLNNSSPRLDCFPNKRTQDIFGLENGRGLQIGNLSTVAAQESLRAQLYREYAENKLTTELCEKRVGDFLRYISTTAVVRDLEYFASVLEGKNTPVNYAGFSYGTVIGAYFVNMYPERVGRILIDGVVDSYSWANEVELRWGPDAFQDAEKAFGSFVDGCIEAGSERCPLALNATTAQQLDGRIRKAVADLVILPLPVPHALRPGLLTSIDVKRVIFIALYKPRVWTDLATKLAALLAGDGAPFLSAVQSRLDLSDTTSRQSTGSAVEAVICTDGPPPSVEYTVEERVQQALEAAIDSYESTTTLFSGLEAVMTCSSWKLTASERFTGPWNSSLANPMLIIGNTADPTTPVANAKRINEHLADSRLVVQDGPGHCSLAQASLCTGKVLREYFVDGILPPNGKVCPVSEDLFPPQSPAGNSTIDGLAITGKWASGKEGRSLSSDDFALLRKLKAFGEAAQDSIGVFRGL